MKDLILSILAIILFFQLGCGTDTGNPGLRTPKNDGSIEAVPFVTGFVSEICARIQFCHPGLSSQRCEIGIYNQELMVPSLGLDIKSFSHLVEVYEAEIKKILIPNPLASQCLEDINKLNCENGSVKGAFNQNSDQPFSKAHEMVPQSCENSY